MKTTSLELAKQLKEIWKPIKGFERMYQVSNFGNVRHCKNHKILKPSLRRRYYAVSLSKNNYWKSYSTHRLVAIAFISNKNDYPEVNHKNGDRLDNRLQNLEWVTAKQNTAHSFKIGTRKYLETDQRGRFKPAL